MLELQNQISVHTRQLIGGKIAAATLQSLEIDELYQTHSFVVHTDFIAFDICRLSNKLY